MANKIQIQTKLFHGRDPQSLIDKITRNKIYSCNFYKSYCFGLNAETYVDCAIGAVRYVGGLYSAYKKPTKFLCLVLKLLQIAPSDSIIEAFINARELKYLMIIGIFYLRLTSTPTKIYNTLMPIYNDYRKILRKSSEGTFTIDHIDNIIDELLNNNIVFDINLPFLPHSLTYTKNFINNYISLADDELNEPDNGEVV